MKIKAFQFILCALLCSATLFAEDSQNDESLYDLSDYQSLIEFSETPLDVLDIDDEAFIAKADRSNKKKSKPKKVEAPPQPPAPEAPPLQQNIQNKKPKKKKKVSEKRLARRDQRAKKYSRWPARGEPYWAWIGNIQPYKLSLFTQTNIGIGFLYFSDIQTNLRLQPTTLIPFTNSIPYQNRLSYNRSALFEYMVGYRILYWLKAALSYQNQQAVSIQTKYMLARPNAGANTAFFGQLSAYLELNALSGRVFFELPWPMIWGKTATTPYLSMAVGAGWQSWTNVYATYIQLNSAPNSISPFKVPLKQKVSPNAIFLVDLGFRVQPSKSAQLFSLTGGCKFNYWGQALNIGNLRDQNNYPISLTSAFRIKSIYSFAPYLGFQWNFVDIYPCYIKDPKKHLVIWDKKLGKQRLLFTQLNIGPNFLYESKTQAFFQPLPVSGFRLVGGSPMSGRLKKNKTPLFEYLIGIQPLQWFKYCVSYQNQQNIGYETKTLPSINPVAAKGFNKLNAEVELNSIMAKFYFQWFFSVFKGVFISPYASVGLGAGWQSWTNVVLSSLAENATALFPAAGVNTINLRQKISVNCVWMADLGLNLTTPAYYFPFNLSLGCKYNQWGKSPNLGKVTQQGTFKTGILHPFSIRTLYSFAPYMAIEWDFPVDYNYKVNKKSTNLWKPYWINVSNFQTRHSVYANMNIGVGVLGFDRIRANVGSIPANLDNTVTSVPYKFGLHYNITPVYEYIIGYRARQWLNLTLSYNRQSNIYVETSYLPADQGTLIPNAFGQLKARLGLDMLLFKPYFELPWPMVWKGWITSPYLGVGIGAAWQSWTDVTQSAVGLVNRPALITGAVQSGLRQKIMASCGWSVDLGLRIRNAIYNAPLSIVVGCKYNQWGQTRNLGALNQQENFKRAITRPLRIRVVFSFAPYMGVQWNF